MVFVFHVFLFLFVVFASNTHIDLVARGPTSGDDNVLAVFALRSQRMLKA